LIARLNVPVFAGGVIVGGVVASLCPSIPWPLALVYVAGLLFASVEVYRRG